MIPSYGKELEMPSNASVLDATSYGWSLSRDGRPAVRCESFPETNTVRVDFADADMLPEGFGKLEDLLSQLNSVDDFSEDRRGLARESYEAGEPKTLTYLRMLNGMSQAQLAERMGTSQAAISRLEAGLQEPRLKTLLRLAEVLSVDMNELSTAFSYE